MQSTMLILHDRTLELYTRAGMPGGLLQRGPLQGGPLPLQGDMAPAGGGILLPGPPNPMPMGAMDTNEGNTRNRQKGEAAMEKRQKALERKQRREANQQGGAGKKLFFAQETK